MIARRGVKIATQRVNRRHDGVRRQFDRTPSARTSSRSARSRWQAEGVPRAGRGLLSGRRPRRSSCSRRSGTSADPRAIRAIRSISTEVPIVAQMTIRARRRRRYTPHAAADRRRCTATGASVIGVNCGASAHAHARGPRGTRRHRVRAAAFGHAEHRPGSWTAGATVRLSSPDISPTSPPAPSRSAPRIVGGCCTTTQAHIRAMRKPSPLTCRPRRCPRAPEVR